MQLLLGDARAAPLWLIPCSAPLFQQKSALFHHHTPKHSHVIPLPLTLAPFCHAACIPLVFFSLFFLVRLPWSLSLSLPLSDGESSNNSDSEAEEDVGVDDMQNFEPGALPAVEAADKEEMEEEEEGGGGTGGALGGTGGTANSTSAQDKESSSDEFEDDDMDKY
jgi:hypothetical protein